MDLFLSKSKHFLYCSFMYKHNWNNHEKKSELHVYFYMICIFRISFERNASGAGLGELLSDKNTCIIKEKKTKKRGNNMNGKKM